MFALPPLVSLLPMQITTLVQSFLKQVSLHLVALCTYRLKNSLKVSQSHSIRSSILCVQKGLIPILCVQDLLCIHPISHSLICLVSFRLSHINMAQTNRLILFPGTEWHQQRRIYSYQNIYLYCDTEP